MLVYFLKIWNTIFIFADEILHDIRHPQRCSM